MGGEGAMMAANNSLKNNRNLVSKRKERNALEGSYANAEMKTFPKATESQLRQIREKMTIARKRNAIRQYALFAVVMIVIFGLVYFYFI